MSLQSWQETLITAQADGTTLVSSTTPTSIIPAAARYTLPSNYFSVVGKQLRIRASGRSGSGTASTGNITFDVRFGTVATPIIVWNGAATALNTATIPANATWELEVLLTCRAIGSGTSANMIGVGKWISRHALNAPVVGTTTGVGAVLLPDTAPAVGTGFDSTITNVVDLFAAFSVSSANQTIQLHQYTLESLN
jgi:hypothetical protein